ncbi:hypothetical protein [Sporosarcina sp. Te-1]|uniref:hypothetical protein n=1 Tax=Sporosarcina sp. Te-1 TaxID=2818390 RepID=UPI001A9F37BC|nr:hypothetical protein [Sporosarcina sp. Te-1]QTD42068.1 hypothetical protein J3U78_04325 [Sporosarcina sp. Te-1]
MEQCPMCFAMKELKKEQELLTCHQTQFRFIKRLKEYDCIPFTLSTANRRFHAFHRGKPTPFFLLESIDEQTGCVMLTLLEPLDIEGNHAFPADTFFSLQKTDSCVTVVPCCFCSIEPLPLECVGRPLPVREPKG